MAEKIKGGKADGVPDSHFPKEKLDQGIKVEMEHTGDREAAKEITKDHYTEEEEATGKKPKDLKYYDDLKKVEDGWKKTAGVFFASFEKAAADGSDFGYVIRNRKSGDSPLGYALGNPKGEGAISYVLLNDEKKKSLHAQTERRRSAGIAGLSLGGVGAMAGGSIPSSLKTRALSAVIGGIGGAALGAGIGSLAGNATAKREIGKGFSARYHRDVDSARDHVASYGKAYQ